MSRSVNLRDYLATQSPEFQAQVAQGAERLLQEVVNSHAIRQAIETSTEAGLLRHPSNLTDRAERRAARALRTLHQFATDLGGELNVAIHLPGQPPISIAARAVEQDLTATG